MDEDNYPLWIYRKCPKCGKSIKSTHSRSDDYDEEWVFVCWNDQIVFTIISEYTDGRDKKSEIIYEKEASK